MPKGPSTPFSRTSPFTPEPGPTFSTEPSPTTPTSTQSSAITTSKPPVAKAAPSPRPWAAAPKVSPSKPSSDPGISHPP